MPRRGVHVSFRHIHVLPSIRGVSKARSYLYMQYFKLVILVFVINGVLIFFWLRMAEKAASLRHDLFYYLQNALYILFR